MSFEIRQLTSLDEVSPLLDRAFSVPQGKCYYDDFEIWKVRSIKNPFVLGAFDNKTLMATASFCLNILKLPAGKKIQVASIGAVATDERYRQKGHAKRLLDLLMLEIEKTSAEISVLFSSVEKYYTKWNFGFFGREFRLDVQSCITYLESICNEDARPVQQGMSSFVFEMLKKRPLGFELQDSDQSWIAEQKNIRWFWIENGAYIAFEKGIDLQNMVHEWGGEPSALLKILKTLVKDAPQAQLMSSPYLARFAEIQKSVSENPIGLVKILKPEKLYKNFRGAELPESWKGLKPEELLRRFSGSLEMWVWGLDAF